MKGLDERDDGGNHGKQRRGLLEPSAKVEFRRLTPSPQPVCGSYAAGWADVWVKK
jgi:hypothetical protein